METTRKLQAAKEDQVIGTACHLHGTTSRKPVESECVKIVNDLLQRNRDLEQFAYIISHNLRAPVANIIGIADIMRTMELGAEDKTRMMGHLITSVEQMDEVIIDLNRILQVKGGASEKKEAVNFHKLLSNIQLSIANLLREEQVHFITDFTAVNEIWTLKSYLHSIFFNLISNSIKYRQASIYPIIEIISRKTVRGIDILFKDNGLGMDLNKIGEKLFGLYKRFHTHTHSDGKGMGLYMVKTQIEALGGSISIESVPNNGTTFTIEFPHTKGTGHR